MRHGHAFTAAATRLSAVAVGPSNFLFSLPAEYEADRDAAFLGSSEKEGSSEERRTSHLDAYGTVDGSCLFHGDHDDLDEMSHYSIQYAEAFELALELAAVYAFK
jgi:hypothetical protein